MAPRLLICTRVAAELRVPVAVVLTSFEPGGTERQMTELIRRLDPQRFRVHVACFRREGAWLPRAAAAAEEIAEFRLRSFKSPATLSMIRDVAAWLRSRSVAVLQACDLAANVVALPAGALAAVPVRIGARRELAPPDKTRAHLLAQRLAYRAAHRIVANSNAGAGRLRDEGVSNRKITVIPNGIDLADYRPAGPRQHRRIVATVANLRPEKGHDVLLRAAVLVRRHVPDVRFRVIGDGPEQAALHALAATLGVADIVDFLGHREDVPMLLADADVFAFPSRTEAFPNGVIEAMAAGLPVVTSAVGGMLELIEHDRNGLLVPPGDEHALAAAIINVIGRESGADALGRAARATIESRYSFERMVAAFTDLYATELAARAPTTLMARGRLAAAPASHADNPASAS